MKLGHHPKAQFVFLESLRASTSQRLDLGMEDPPLGGHERPWRLLQLMYLLVRLPAVTGINPLVWKIIISTTFIIFL